MKVVYRLIVMCVLLAICSCSKDKSETKTDSSSGSSSYYYEYAEETEEGGDESEVYICTGGHSKRYHIDEFCQGLSRCSGSIECITVGEAEDMGRTPCKWCTK